MPAGLVIRRHTGDITGLQAATLTGDVPLAQLPDDHLWVAFVGNEAVGFVLFRDWGHGVICLERAGVLPEYAGQGVYQRLLRAAHRGLPRARLVTYTANRNIASARGLLAAGWKLYEPTVRWGWPDGLYFTKVLP